MWKVRLECLGRARTVRAATRSPRVDECAGADRGCGHTRALSCSYVEVCTSGCAWRRARDVSSAATAVVSALGAAERAKEGTYEPVRHA